MVAPLKMVLNSHWRRRGEKISDTSSGIDGMWEFVWNLGEKDQYPAVWHSFPYLNCHLKWYTSFSDTPKRRLKSEAVGTNFCIVPTEKLGTSEFTNSPSSPPFSLPLYILVYIYIYIIYIYLIYPVRCFQTHPHTVTYPKKRPILLVPFQVIC